VTRQAVYEQFGDRAALFAQVVAVVEEQAFAAIGARAQDGWQPELRSWVRDNYANMFAFVAANPDSFPVLREAERAGDLALTRLRGRLAQVYTEASRQRWAALGVEPGRADRVLVTLYFAMTEALVQASWDGEPPDREALIDLLTEFTVGGVRRLHEHTPDVITRLR
jgi:AcrR family transcriptional regulator